MQINAFDHVNVKTSNLEAMVAWYDQILGMKSGKRPDFPFPGAWLYLGEQAIIHLVGVAEEPAADDPKIEHYAFSATGLSEFLAHLKSHSVEAQTSVVPGFGIVQVNIFDPDGNHIHVDFREQLEA